MNLRSSLLPSAALALAALASCNPIDTLDFDPGGYGVDPGGVQDIAAARHAIDAGLVPDPKWITVEGLLSEHDVPAAGPACQSKLCLRPALGVAPSLETGRAERWVHLGMTTGIDVATFQRPPIDLVVAIDKSGSMTIDMAQTTEAVARLVGHMRPDDRLAVLAFDGAVQVLHELGPVRNKAALQRTIKGLSAEGTWNLNAALDASFSRLATAEPGRMRRVVVLSCGYPQVDEEGTNPTAMQIRARGAEGIGITFVGILLGWSPNLGKLLGETQGANYYHLGDLKHVEEVFDRDFDLIITPLAYELEMKLTPPPGWKLARMYGIPGDEVGAPNDDPADGFSIATAFLSRRRGSIVARLEPVASQGARSARAAQADGGETANASLTYRPEPAFGGPPSEAQSFEVPLEAPAEERGPDGSYYGSPGVRKAVALVNMAVRMIQICQEWQKNERAQAIEHANELVAYLRAEREAQGDAALDVEVALVEKLRANAAAGGAMLHGAANAR